MTDDEIELVAAELAKAGGLSWYAKREHGPLKVVANRYRERARKVVEALDRHRTSQEGTRSESGAVSGHAEAEHDTASRCQSEDTLQVGSTVLYRPPGDRRTYACRVKHIDGSRVFITPEIKACTGWIDAQGLVTAQSNDAPQS
jgi:hypothetical protein